MARYPALFCMTCGRVESVPGLADVSHQPAANDRADANRADAMMVPTPSSPTLNEGARIMASMNALFRLLSPAQRAILMDDVAASMRGMPVALQQRQLAHFGRTDPAYGAGVAARLGISLPTLVDAGNQAG
ncbi:catalase-related domain-containing protein [Nitrospirillum amazonense]|uniref:Catalase-related immune-responsive protein n=1 Tax=Nitrospirillum amazonense TaxID=28077 RepID=A0A560K2R4_9PROT|nr:catalase-related domain-containing protein [Nitrospirillum amazonense]MDG3444080.1 catalase-related domain-containing protein [Nitrospirillum amazonense]TWB77635.1 catalase-related immune-responsive protein [Nitrospirillum amazonense]